MGSPSIVQASPGTALVTTAETVAATTPVLNVDQVGQGVQISGTVTGATGAGVTSVQVRVRAGAGLAGAVVASAVFQEAQGASSFYSMAFQLVDTTVGVPGAPQGQVQYTVTVQQVGATGNGTIAFVQVSAETANIGGS